MLFLPVDDENLFLPIGYQKKLQNSKTGRRKKPSKFADWSRAKAENLVSTSWEKAIEVHQPVVWERGKKRISWFAWGTPLPPPHTVFANQLKEKAANFTNC